MDLPVLPPRAADSHKGHYGLALVIGGSRGMTGAVCLAGMAALRGGAGLVRLAVPESCLAIVAATEPSYMTVALPEDTAGRISLRARDVLLPWVEVATCIGLGPGLGRSAALEALVTYFYTTAGKPMVIDADGLNALAARRQVLDQAAGPRVLTPHPGEFYRLLGSRVDKHTWQQHAVRLAQETGTIVVLKSHRTLVTDGKRQWINTTGNPGMATGGSGDVLTGLITALICQGMEPYDAARLGVFLHGLAGDLAAAELGQESLIASDLVRFLPKSFIEYSRLVDRESRRQK